MGQAWYGVPANGEGDAALLRQANDLNSSHTNDASSAASTGAVDPVFVQKLIEEAAAQVYEDVHLQLKNIQEESLQKTEQMVSLFLVFLVVSHFISFHFTSPPILCTPDETATGALEAFGA